MEDGCQEGWKEAVRWKKFKKLKTYVTIWGRGHFFYAFKKRIRWNLKKKYCGEAWHDASEKRHNLVMCDALKIWRVCAQLCGLHSSDVTYFSTYILWWYCTGVDCSTSTFIPPSQQWCIFLPILWWYCRCRLFHLYLHPAFTAVMYFSTYLMMVL